MRPLDPRLLRRAHAARRLLGADVAFGIATAILVLLQATLLARVIARSFEGASLDDVSTELVLLALLFAGRAVLAWAFELAGRRAATGVLSQLRLELVEKRLRHEPVALDGVESAEIATLATHGIGPLEAYFGRFLPQVVLALVVPVAVLAWVIAIDVTSALVMLVTLPLVPVFMVVIGRYTERKARARAQALALLATRFLDVVRGLPTLRAYNRSRAQADSLARAGDDYRRTTMQTLRVAFVSGAVLELAATLGIALVAVTDRRSAHRRGHRVRGRPDGPAPRSGAVSAAARRRRAVSRERGRHRGGRAPARADGDDGGGPRERTRRTATPTNGSIVRLQGVSYGYPARPGRVLDDVDLELLPGETVVLVGSSGSGKSTLGSIVLGLLEPSAGRVLRDGVESGAEGLAAWRHHVAWVPQRPTLFTGTVADNIRLGDPDADDEHVRDAARRAEASAFIGDLPDGYETVIGDGGRPLSAGEAQRIALARAFLRDARLVILDEPTANLDAVNAEAVTEAMSRLSEGRALLVIAHRPELARNADRIVRLEAGRLVDDRGRGGRLMWRTLAGIVRLARPPAGWLAASVLFGTLAVAFGIGLMTSAGYLIASAAERPAILSLTTVIVAVRFFGLARPVARYLERVVSHDLAFRVLARLRLRFYERIEPLAPAGLDAYRRGDLVSRMVGDVDTLQTLYLRGLGPPLVASLAGAAAVGVAAAILPAAAIVLAAGLLVEWRRRRGRLRPSRPRLRGQGVCSGEAVRRARGAPSWRAGARRVRA